ncbi:HYR domain-containing protein [Cystobacter fuscus]
MTSSPASGSVFRHGATRVTVTATDAAGNSAQCSFQVTVQATVVSIAGGGCQSTGSGTASSLALLLGLAWWSGRRRRHSAPRDFPGVHRLGAGRWSCSWSPCLPPPSRPRAPGPSSRWTWSACASLRGHGLAAGGHRSRAPRGELSPAPHGRLRARHPAAQGQ